MSAPVRAHAVVAGGGVGGLEAALCLRALAADRIDVTLLAPEREFVYRPLAVGEPFGLGAVVRRELATVARDAGFALVRDTLAVVEPDLRTATTGNGAMIDYDHLILALGARPQPAVPGALTFGDPGDAARIAVLLATVARRGAAHIVFAAPTHTWWTLPLYELALLTAKWARRRSLPLRISVVAAEPGPVTVFGPTASAEVARLLEAAAVDAHCGDGPRAFAGGRLELADGSRLPATAVIALPRPTGVPVPGIPRDADGFVEVDARCRVSWTDFVYAVGDMTAGIVKQGGVAAQQAEVAARTIAHLEGAADAPRPYRPVLRGMLLTGASPLYLRNDPGDASEAVAHEPPWWPPHKIASRYLGPYLAATAHARL